VKALSECLLYGIVDTGYVPPGRLTSMTADLIKGGADIIQLRAKRQSKEEILGIARILSPLCRDAGIPFILNDHPDLVPTSGASGVHVGQEDFPVEEARRLAGPGAVVGKSTHSLDQALSASRESPDYLGFGPLFPTPTKPDYTPIGMDHIRTVHARISVPVFCIGGIKLPNLRQVLGAGAQRVAVVSDLLLAEDPVRRTAECKSMLTSRAPA
jgi:thiamine-phosphate pyrophosphorylase